MGRPVLENSGINPVEAAEAGPVPTELVAHTEQLYTMSFLRPATVTMLEALSPVKVLTPSEQDA